MLLDIVSKNIRYYRLQVEMSQEKLAELSNLHRTYISSVELGKRNISINNIERIAKALNIDSYNLLIKIDGVEYGEE